MFKDQQVGLWQLECKKQREGGAGDGWWKLWRPEGNCKDFNFCFEEHGRYWRVLFGDEK